MKHIHILWAVMLTFLTVLALPAHAARFNPKRTQKIASENDFVQLVENMANSMQPTAYIVFEKKMSPLFLKNLNRQCILIMQHIIITIFVITKFR